jgi:hypothetical protein
MTSFSSRWILITVLALAMLPARASSAEEEAPERHCIVGRTPMQFEALYGKPRNHIAGPCDDGTEPPDHGTNEPACLLWTFADGRGVFFKNRTVTFRRMRELPSQEGDDQGSSLWRLSEEAVRTCTIGVSRDKVQGIDKTREWVATACHSPGGDSAEECDDVFPEIGWTFLCSGRQAAQELARETKGEIAAAAASRKACKAGNAKECTAIGLDEAEGRGVQKDDTLAVELFRRACDGGDIEGCVEARRGPLAARL